MHTIGGTISAVALAVTGYGWALYFAGSAIVVAATVAVEHLRTKGTTHG